MEKRTFKDWPAVLQRRWLLAGAVGVGFLLVGSVMYFALGDRTLLLLSALLAVFTALRCLYLYHIACDGAYETVEGVCIGIGRAGLRNQRKVRMLQHDGNEYTIMLDKRTRLRMGNCYRVYFREDNSSTGLFPDFLAENLFLGLEDLGAHHVGTAGVETAGLETDLQ